MSDIGKYFDGRQFTRAEYEDVEARYLAAIRLFARDSSVLRMKVLELEPGSDEDLSSVTPDGWVTIDQALAVAKQVLREKVWCKLELEDQFRVHFGYDYYMYIESAFRCCKAAEEVRALGLFVEENFPSPYGIAGEAVGG